MMENIDTSKKYILAVSGGSDSMAMLHMFCVHKPKLMFSVVTINHHLRAESLAECQLVEQFCKQFGVQCQVFDVDVNAFSQQHKLSIETAARQLRYQIFNTLDCHFVCLAHNSDDNAETVLMHILRGSGMCGAKGILPVRQRYFRPLLHFSKTQLTEYCQKHNVPYAVDKSNFDSTLTRNFVRNEVFPLLKKVNANAIQNLNKFSQNAGLDDEFIQTFVDISTVEFGEDFAKIPNQLLMQHKAVAYRVLRCVFQKLGIASDIEKVHFDSILQLQKNFGGKSVSLPFDLIATNDYNSITIFVKKPKQTFSAVNFFDFFGQVDKGKICSLFTPFGTVNVSLDPLPHSLKFDMKKIPESAVLRTRTEGDFFNKFGGGTKPLNRYLIDKKIPQRLRDNLLLICDKNEVLVVCGVEISQKVQVCQQTDVICFLNVTKQAK